MTTSMISDCRRGASDFSIPYPGELACSTFERLFTTQAELYERVVGVKPVSDEQKALAAWLWRNTHCYHGPQRANPLGRI